MTRFAVQISRFVVAASAVGLAAALGTWMGSGRPAGDRLPTEATTLGIGTQTGSESHGATETDGAEEEGSQPKRFPTPSRWKNETPQDAEILNRPPRNDGEASAREVIKQEFLAIAERLEQSENPYLGRRQIARIAARLASAGFPEQVSLRVQLAGHELRLGQTSEAVRHIEEAFQQLRTRHITPPLAMHKARAIAYLRLAEVSNCIRRHNSDCCIFPLAGRGVHGDKSAAREAKSSLLAILAQEPEDLLFQWLLNIACMALGEFPDGVPEPFRCPDSALRWPVEVGRFVDVAPSLGVDTFDQCGGVIVEDFDRDGFLDIVSSTFDPRGPLTYHRNGGDGTFQNLTVPAGLDCQLGGLNCIGGDYDNDGDMDILVLRGAWLMDDGRIRNSLLRNHGDGTFSDVTHAAGLASPAYPSQTAVWGDFDNDGWLDLFVGNESRMDQVPPGGDYPCQLFRNRGDGTFVDVAVQAGVTNDRYCKGVTAGDYDNDGDLDIYVSNVGANRLYRNNGDGTFHDVAPRLLVTEPAGRSFACWFFDYNNDGWLDLFVAGYRATPADLLADYRGLEHGATLPRLYRNDGQGGFSDVTAEVELDHVYLPMGANFGDLDNDGFLDIFLATGDPYFETLMPNVMLKNDRGSRFQNVTTAGGLGHLQKGHGVAFADFDHDGDQDLFNQLGGFYPGDAYHNALFVNPGHGNHYLVVKLRGTASNRQAVGARITVEVRSTDGSRHIHRAVGSTSSFGGSPLRQEIGLGRATAIEKVSIQWPTSGTRQELQSVPIGQMIVVTEGEPEFQVVSRNQFQFLTAAKAR